jgi:hypothetical protein
MKINWKVVIALALIAVVSYWAVDAVRQRSYTGANLTFSVGRGPVTVTNPSDESVLVQLTSPETRAFQVSSAIEGAAGVSEAQGVGRDRIQFLEFTLPSGVSEFTITRGSNVYFNGETDINLEATVQPLTPSEAPTPMIAAALVVAAALFYVFRTTGHLWMSALRRQEVSDHAAEQLAERANFKRMFGRVSSGGK